MKCSYYEIDRLPSPCYIINCDTLYSNLAILQERSNILGVNPLLAIKGFPLALLFNNIAPFLCGISASSHFEAKLGQHMGKEIHIHSPAYKFEDFDKIMRICDHIVFNSIGQWNTYKRVSAEADNKVSFGLRINPEFSSVEIDKYNPCLPHSRFGVTADLITPDIIAGIEGFHLHVMCDQGAKTLSEVINVVVEKYGKFLSQIKWINLGGGHQLVAPDYQIDILRKPIAQLTSDFGLKVYIEPCEGIVTSSGYLVCTVLDIVDNGLKTAILDTSALCHMPDVLDMPYCPDIVYPTNGTNNQYSYVLAGASCLPGDIIGEYKFERPLSVGDKIIFGDMGAYTFARENYFNGINYPSIVLFSHKDGVRIVKEYSYKNYEQLYI